MCLSGGDGDKENSSASLRHGGAGSELLLQIMKTQLLRNLLTSILYLYFGPQLAPIAIGYKIISSWMNERQLILFLFCHLSVLIQQRWQSQPLFIKEPREWKTWIVREGETLYPCQKRRVVHFSLTTLHLLSCLSVFTPVIHHFGGAVTMAADDKGRKKICLTKTAFCLGT